MFPLKEFLEWVKSAHTSDWMNFITRFVRWNMSPMVTLNEAREGMEYLLGKQDLTYVRNLFQDPAKLNLQNKNNPQNARVGKQYQSAITASNIPANYPGNEMLYRDMEGTNFKPFPIWEVFMRIIINEAKKSGINVEAKATDPTSQVDKESDRALIEKRAQIEHDLSKIYTSIGQKPYKVQDHKARFGEKIDKGNTSKFDDMGLNPQDPTDVKFFFDHFHKLDWEGSIETAIQYLFSFNGVQDQCIDKWVTDALAKKAMSAQHYVDKVSGALILDYVAPETVYIYGSGRRKDYNDANAKVIERKVSMKELFHMIGDSFDIEAQWDNLLLAISYANNVEFTGIQPSYARFSNGDGRLNENASPTPNAANGVIGQTYGYNDFMKFKVTLGYIEINSQNFTMDDAFAGAMIGGAKGGAIMDNPKGKEEWSIYQSYVPKNGERYQNKALYQTPTYKSFYIALSAVTQVLFDFGQMEYSRVEGNTDYNQNFSILTWREIGDPLVIITKQLIDKFQELWYKLVYQDRRAKAKGVDYNYDSILAIAETMFADAESSQSDRVMKVINWLDSSSNSVWTFPRDADGNIVHQSINQLNIERENGYSKQYFETWNLLWDIWEKIGDVAGISKLRRGDEGDAKQPVSTNFQALRNSEASTGYIMDMLNYMFREASQRWLFFIQDILNFSEYVPMAYKFLENALGEPEIEKLKQLGRDGIQRMGIFIESFDQTAMRQKLDVMLNLAIQNQTITLSQWLLIQNIKSSQKAFQTFAFFEERNRKAKQQEAQQAQQSQQQSAMQIEQERTRQEQMKGDYMLENTKLQNAGSSNDHIINQKGSIAKQQLKLQGDKELIVAQAEVDLNQLRAQNNQDLSVPTPALPQTQPAPQQPTPQQQQILNDQQPSQRGAPPLQP